MYVRHGNFYGLQIGVQMEVDLTKNLGYDRFAELVGMKLIMVSHGHAIAQMEITEQHMNGVGIVQGGVIFTLADYAFAAASNTADTITLGLQTSVTFFRTPQGKCLTAEAKEITASRKISGYTVDVMDENNDVIAQMTAVGYMKKR
jgi:acyl-CoA thioesterase